MSHARMLLNKLPMEEALQWEESEFTQIYQTACFEGGGAARALRLDGEVTFV